MRAIGSDANKIMVISTGAYGNIGDAVIRRRIVKWVADLGVPYIYIGNGDAEWVEQLHLPHNASVYNASHKLRWLLLPLSWKPVKALVFDPGAIPLNRSAFPVEMIYTTLTLIVRIRGGVVIRPPRGIGNGARSTVWVHRLGVALSNVSLWRTKRSLEIIRIGELSPDTAFQEPKIWRQVDDDNRTVLGISLRGKNAFPSDEWFAAVRHFGEIHKSDLVVFSQVREDEERAPEIADRLGATHLAWGDRTEAEQEAELQSLYKRTSLLISDRLHVLILGALSGAIPIEIVDSPSGKVREHFSQIGVHKVSFSVREALRCGLGNIVTDTGSRRHELRCALDNASEKLHEAENRIRKLVG